jgi:Flp pilus assembly protein TadD
MTRRNSACGLATVSLLLGVALSGCASSSSETQSLLSDATGSLAGNAPKGTAAAHEYWANALMRNPRDENAAIGYARALKAEGSKDKALSALQQAAIYNSDSKAIASEEGRLALDMGQTGLAEKLLARANDPEHPDWRVLNALGTLEAQRGNTAPSRTYFEQAAQLAPNEPSVLNNLALTYALAGDPAKAEALLRRAGAASGATAKVRQNLALVLGVEGKYDESQQLAASDLGKDKTDANRAYMQKMVAATPVALGKTVKASKTANIQVPASAWATDVAPVATKLKPVLADAGTLPWAKTTKAAKQN